MEQKILMIVNPASAGRQTAKEWPDFERQLRENGFEFEVIYTEYSEHATELTRDALKSGFDLIVSVGGDGTMNEVVNGFFESGKPIKPNASLAVFSRGTGCDFIKSLGVEKGFNGFLSLLKRNTTKAMDIGEVTYHDYNQGMKSRYFLNISDIGLGGDTTYRINKTAKSLKGFLSFMINAVISILFYRNKHMQVTINGKEVYNQRLNSVIMANGKYFGGGMLIAPDAELDDGEFDIVVLGDLNTYELITSFPLIYKGEHFKHPKVKLFRGKHVTVKSTEAVRLDIDGEQPGTTDAEFRIIEKAIRVLV